MQNNKANAAGINGTPDSGNNAQEANSQGLVITPNIIIINDTDQGKSYPVKIINLSKEEYALDITETRLIRNAGQKLQPVDTPITAYILELSTNYLVIPAESEKTLTVKIVSTEFSPDTYPGVLFSRSNRQQTNKPGAVINSALIVGVLTQNSQAEIKADNTFTVDYSVLSTNSNFKVLGAVRNSGGKFFDPSGSVSVFKDGVKIYEKQITSQVRGLLFPEEQKEYAINWLNRLNPFEKIGNYSFSSSINIPGTDKSFSSQINFFYIPIDALILIAVIAIASLVVLLWIGKKARRRIKGRNNSRKYK